PATATWYLRTEANPGAPDAGRFSYGAPGWTPVVGDWDANGTTTVGVIDPRTSVWYLHNSNTPGAPDGGQFQFGVAGWKAVVGNWGGHVPAGKQAQDLSLQVAVADLALVPGSQGTVQRSGHMAGGYCHCAFCQNAVARANAATNSTPVVLPGTTE